MWGVGGRGRAAADTDSATRGPPQRQVWGEGGGGGQNIYNILNSNLRALQNLNTGLIGYIVQNSLNYCQNQKYDSMQFIIYVQQTVNT